MTTPAAAHGTEPGPAQEQPFPSAAPQHARAASATAVTITANLDADPAPLSGTGAMSRGQSEPSGRQIAILKQKSRKKTKSSGGPEPVFEGDLNHFVSNDGSVGEILVKNTRTRVRVPRLKNGQAKGRRVDSSTKMDEKQLGLTFRMMLGVRVAVGRQANSPDAPLQEEDYTHVDKYTFPPAGANGRLPTPSHKLNKTFKFRDYAPKVFKKLRQQFGIDESSYMLSVAGNYDYLELITNSKSGSFFFYSHDQRYIIKNMKREEAKFFRSIIPQYYEHHVKHPDSLLIRFCGMYLVKAGRKKIPFIVMECVEGGTTMKVHTKFDLKGSTVHRTAKEGEKVLKDNNMRKSETKIHLGSQRDAFLKVVRADAEFLCSVNVMDYSMLLSIHESKRAQEAPVDRRTLLQRTYSEFFTFADEAVGKTEPSFKTIPTTRASSLGAVSEMATSDVDKNMGNRPKAPLKSARSCRDAMALSTINFRPDGGIESEGDGPKEIYWMGVIDVLQQYTALKHAETHFKAIGRVKDELSCVAPRQYCDRFIGFMEERTD